MHPHNQEDSFETRLKNTRLTKKGMEIAQYLLDNLTKVGFMSATSISKELHISDVTVIRFARSLGFDGYSNMQNALQKRMSDYMESNQALLAYPSQVLQVNLEMSSNATMVELAVNNNLKNISKFADRNNDEVFLQAAEIILGSKRKIVMGLRGSAAIAFSMGMRLRYLVDDVFDIIRADPNDTYPLYTMTEEDCLLIFGFVNYPQASIDAVDFARKRGAKIIALTDKETAPIAYQADAIIICSVNGISFSSYTIPMLATEIITANMAKILGPANDSRNRETVESMRKSGYFPDAVKSRVSPRPSKETT